MDQERILEITAIERQTRELEENMQIVESQIIELENFKRGLEEIKSSKEKEILSSIGGRVYIKSEIVDIEKIYVEVGAGVIVKKSPNATLEIVNSQILRLKEVRSQIASYLDAHQRRLEEFLIDMREKEI